MNYEGLAFLSEAKLAESGNYEGRNIEELGFTVQQVINFGREGTLEKHGIGISDYFLMVVDGKTYTMQIGGIDHYYGTLGDTNHGIDWISKECIPKAIKWNLTTNNNGKSDIQVPYACCNLKLWLNAEAGTCGDGSPVDYTSDGFLALMRTTGDANAQVFLNNLVEKKYYAETRYSSAGVLTEGSGGAMVSLGKLWIPFEVEVLGRNVYSNPQYNGAFGRQYPIFKAYKNIPKKVSGSTSFCVWWLASVPAGSSSYACCIDAAGRVGYCTVAVSGTYAPVCGRT